ncbi:hypothetical protein [Pseudophaeobacter sp.]|uniref:hypothetical protein n=1 Tax=Pseudophaeobacter sp. TaxID=1971739 RepID=UPI0032986DA5
MQWNIFQEKGLRTALHGAVLTLFISFPVGAQAWWAWNRHEVFQVSSDVWEVVNEVGSGAQDYWCGIGDFALRQLRTQATQRIYIWQGIGPSVNRPGRKSVQFSLTPPPGVDTTPRLSLSVKAVGDNLNAATARNYCYDRIEELLYPFN